MDNLPAYNSEKKKGVELINRTRRSYAKFVV